MSVHLFTNESARATVPKRKDASDIATPTPLIPSSLFPTRTSNASQGRRTVHHGRCGSRRCCWQTNSLRRGAGHCALCWHSDCNKRFALAHWSVTGILVSRILLLHHESLGNMNAPGYRHVAWRGVGQSRTRQTRWLPPGCRVLYLQVI